MLENLGDPGRVSRRLFDLVHRRNLVYNQCWEDPAVDGAALALTPADRVLVITSAGCNALDYALSGARVLEEEWSGIFRSAAPGARVIFRSGGRDVRFLPLSVLHRLRFERERAAQLHQRDRVGTYGSFHIARLVPSV